MTKPKRGLYAKSRGKRCAQCGYRTVPGNRFAVYVNERLSVALCMVCFEKLLSTPPD